MAHGDAVVDGDGVELRGEAPEGFDPLFDVLSDFVQVHVPRHELGERVGDADDRAAELFFAHAVGPPEAAGSRHPAARRGDGASECVFHLSVSVSVCVPDVPETKRPFPGRRKALFFNRIIHATFLPLSSKDHEVQGNDDNNRMNHSQLFVFVMKQRYGY